MSLPAARNRSLRFVPLALLALGPLATAQSIGAVFTQTNSPAGNAVIEFRRAPSGDLAFVATHATRGVGSGIALGSQGSVTLSANGELLFVVNAGDDTLTVLRASGGAWTVADVEPARGHLPVSVAQQGDRVFVLNAGAPANVAGFRLSSEGALDPIPGALEPLSSPDPLPAQVQLGPGGGQLLVTEKATGKIALFPVAPSGALFGGTFVDSAGPTPFGVALSRDGTVIVAESSGAASSYRIGEGMFESVTRSASSGAMSPCWVAVTRDGRYAFAAGGDSGAIAGFAVSGRSGALAPLGDGRSASLGPAARPVGEALSADGRWLYVLSPSTSEIAIFRVGPDGSLVARPSRLGLPASATGLTAR
jgi:6-phosphogluconolactonase